MISGVVAAVFDETGKGHPSEDFRSVAGGGEGVGEEAVTDGVADVRAGEGVGAEATEVVPVGVAIEAFGGERGRVFVKAMVPKGGGVYSATPGELKGGRFPCEDVTGVDLRGELGDGEAAAAGQVADLRSGAALTSADPCQEADVVLRPGTHVEPVAHRCEGEELVDARDSVEVVDGVFRDQIPVQDHVEFAHGVRLLILI